MTKNTIEAATEDTTTLTLTAEQQLTKAEHEVTVENWQRGFRQAGEALDDLKTNLVAKGEWKAYLVETFDLTEQKALRLIMGARVCTKLEKLGFTQVPANEGQAFSLSPLVADEERIYEVWKKVLAMDGRPTQAKIESVMFPGEAKGSSVGRIKTYLNSFTKQLDKKLMDVDLSQLIDKQRADLIDSITKIETAMSALRSKVEVATKQAA